MPKKLANWMIQISKPITLLAAFWPNFVSRIILKQKRHKTDSRKHLGYATHRKKSILLKIFQSKFTGLGSLFGI